MTTDKVNDKGDDIIDIVCLADNPPREPVLIVDTQRCRYSSELKKEIERTDLNHSIHLHDLAMTSTEDIEKIDWLLGVPCLVFNENIYLGVDAFSMSRKIARESLLK